MAAAIMAAIIPAAVATAQAGPIGYGNPGTANPVTYTFRAAATGDVMAYFMGSGASFTESVGLLANGVLTSGGFGLDNHKSSYGQAFNFGRVNAGDVLVFVLNVTTPNNGYVYSDAAMNSAYDRTNAFGHNHIYSTAFTSTDSVPSGTYVGFEDQRFANSDFNYRDETYVFTNVAVPEPLSLAVLATGLVGLGLASGWRRPRSNPAATGQAGASRR